MKRTFSPISKTLRSSIVVYETELSKVQEAIESCLLSPIEVQLTVIDNSPSGVLRAPIESMGVEYMWTGKNLGYGAGHNIALRKSLARSAYHLVINPDVRFGPEVLPTLYSFMESDPAIGLVMPRVLYPDRTEQRLCKLLPTPFDLLVRRFGGSWAERMFRDRIERFVLSSVDLSTPRVVPSLSGCFMLLRTSVLQQVGLFDERYFLYMEDFDLCRRISEVSKTVFFPEVSIFHDHGRSSYRNARALASHLHSAFQYFQKWGWFEDAHRDRMNRLAETPEAEVVPATPGVKAA